MKLTDITRRAARSLKNAKARTLLTSLAIAVGAFTITLAFAAGEGGRQYAEDIVSSNTDVRELYVQPRIDQTGADFTAPQEYNEGPVMDYGGGFSMEMLEQADIDRLEALDNVSEVTPVYNASAKYVTRDGEKKYQAGIEPYSDAIKVDVLAGDPENLTPEGVVVPSGFIEALGFDSPEAAIGQPVDIVMNNAVTNQDKVYQQEVVAVFQSSVLAAVSSTSLQVDSQTVADMYEFSQAGTPMEDAFLGAIVMAVNESDVDDLKQVINEAGYDAQTAEDLMGFLFQFINVLMGILIGFGALAVLTSVFGIINTQYISVLERTQQIGLMKALGARRRDVGRLFKIEAAWIGFLGGALGAGAAFVAGTLANPWISETLSLGDDIYLLIFEPLPAIAIVVGLMLVAVAAGIFPARKAAKLDPIEALRTE